MSKTIKIDLKGGGAAYVLEDLTMGQFEQMEWLEAVWAPSAMPNATGGRLSTRALIADILAAVVKFEGREPCSWPPLPPVLTLECEAIAARAEFVRQHLTHKEARQIQTKIVELMGVDEALEGK
jgi:hypothetical protein